MIIFTESERQFLLESLEATADVEFHYLNPNNPEIEALISSDADDTSFINNPQVVNGGELPNFTAPEIPLDFEDNILSALFGASLKNDKGDRPTFDTTELVIPTPKEIKEHLDQRVIGQHQAKRKLAVALFNNYMNHKTSGTATKNTILMSGPSGSGKTLIVENIAALFGVPFCTIDASSLTAAGYVGKGVDTIVELLLKKSNNDKEKASHGIVFIDEVDKIATRPGRDGGRDIGGETVQQELLKLMEGVETVFEVNRSSVTFSTKKVTFIFAGAFVGMDKIIANRTAGPVGSIGFGRDIKNEELILTNGATAADFQEYGMIPEFMGRITTTIELDALTEDDYFDIATKVDNNVTGQYRALFANTGLKLEITDEQLRTISNMAFSMKLGARGMKKILEQLLFEHMFEQTDCVVTDEMVAELKKAKF